MMLKEQNTHENMILASKALEINGFPGFIDDCTKPVSNSEDASTGSTCCLEESISSIDADGEELNIIEVEDDANSGGSSKKVTFREGRNEYYDNELYDEDEARDSWLDRDDYARFKTVTSYIVDSVGQTARRALSENNMAQSFMELTIKAYSACCQHENIEGSIFLTEDEQSVMNQIYKDTGAVLHGLEKAIVRQVARDVQERRREIVYTVEEIQDLEADLCNEDPNKLDMEIRKACEQLSQPSKLFAQHLALLHKNLID